MLKTYIVTAEGSKRSKVVDQFNFLITALDYKEAWINARAALAYGQEIEIVSFEGDDYFNFKRIETRKAAPSQYVPRKVFTLEKRAESKRKSKLTADEVLAAAETQNIKVSKELRELVAEMKGGKEIKKNQV